MDRLERLTSRRPRAIVLPAIVALHIGLLGLMASMRPDVPPLGPMIMDVTLFSGEGVGASIADAPNADEKAVSEDRDALEPTDRTEFEPTEETASEPSATSEPPPSQSAEPIATEAAAELVDAAAQEAQDVLAMVETIVGTDSEAVAVTTPQMSEVSPEQMEWIAARAGSATGGGCSIEAEVQTRLEQDPPVLGALAAVPRSDRSVANAMQLWNGEWTPHARELAGPLALVRAAVVEVIEDAPARCRNQLVRGPRFVLISDDPSRTTVLALGSGEWRWADLAPPRQPAMFRWLGSGRR